MTTPQHEIALAVEYHNAGRLNEAEPIYRKVLQLSPDEPDALHLLGVVLNGTERSDQAVKLIRRSLQLRSNFPPALYNLGNACWKAGRLTEAATAYRKSIAQDPSKSGIYINLGRCLEEMGDLQEATAVYEAHLRQFGVNGAILYRVTDLYARQNLRQEAVETCRRALDGLEGSAQEREVALSCCTILLNIAWIEDALLAQAYTVARRVLAERPKSVVAFFMIGYYLYSTGRFDTACRLARRVLKRYTALEIAGNNLLRIWYLCRIDRDFFKNLDRLSEKFSELPAIERSVRSSEGNGPVLYFCCDDRYYHHFGPRLIDSIAQTNRDATIHFHVIDPTTATTNAMLGQQARNDVIFNFTSEQTAELPPLLRKGFLRTYYASIRFVRLLEIQAIYGRRVAQIDMDSILVGNFAALCASLPDAEVHILHDGIHSGPSREFNASLFMIDQTPAARRYAELVARYIVYFLFADIPYWMLDQAALYCAHWYLRSTGNAPVTTSVHSRRAAEAIFFSAAEALSEKTVNLDRHLASLTFTT
ncbi:tetratricopeptide repeat protein [Azospirillum melinis]|uniref:tetratricopeptide repeat protein n=1 Tax=Azospirillum melinis TaxID=328839 RepID=UPI0037577EDC